MPGLFGTRQRTINCQIHPESRIPNGAISRDVGIDKRFFGSVTFAATGNSITAANGAFANFIVGDPLIVHGTNLNDGEREVTGIDTVNASYLITDSPGKNEGPVANVEVRTP